MTTKERWEAKNQNKAKGNSQPHVNLTSDTEWNPTEIRLLNASNNTQHF